MSKLATEKRLNFYPALGPCLLDTSILAPGTGDTLPENIFTIRADEKGLGRGKLIATVIVNPRFNQQTVERFRWFFTFAPEVWEALRTAIDNVADTDSVSAYADAFRLLWESSTIMPFASFMESLKRENRSTLEAMSDDEPAPTIIQDVEGGAI